MSSKWTGARAATPRDGDERKERNEPSGNHRRGAAPFYSYENRATRRWDDNRSRRGDVSRSDLVPSEASMLNFSYGERGAPFWGRRHHRTSVPYHRRRSKALVASTSNSTRGELAKAQFRANRIQEISFGARQQACESNNINSVISHTSTCTCRPSSDLPTRFLPRSKQFFTSSEC